MHKLLGLVLFMWKHGLQGKLSLLDRYLSKFLVQKEEVDILYIPSKTFIRKDLLSTHITVWQDRWNNSTKGRNVWEYIPIVNLEKLYSDFFLNQIITGHGIMPAFQQ